MSGIGPGQVVGEAELDFEGSFGTDCVDLGGPGDGGRFVGSDFGEFERAGTDQSTLLFVHPRRGEVGEVDEIVAVGDRDSIGGE